MTLVDAKRSLDGIQEENIAERHVKFNIDFDEWRRYLFPPPTVFFWRTMLSALSHAPPHRFTDNNKGTEHGPTFLCVSSALI